VARRRDARPDRGKIRGQGPLALVALLATSLLQAESLPPIPAVPGPTERMVIATGPFLPDDASFAQYRYPDWFRDAKLGFWAHWGPQSVPMFGDWYARNMYKQGHKQYQDHLERYGHPTRSGWKDVIPLWKAEQWDPERLMALYKKAGARYFVSMGVHHDNFDLWDSRYHRWNAVRMGPHRDVVGEWQKAARAQGLPFGVSEHLGASFAWWQGSHGADKTGPLAGVPYDGADPLWQDLYHPPAAPGDKAEWYSTDPAWQREWFARIQDLVDHYQPDLLYTDGGVPFGNEVGRNLIAHLYNTSAAGHGGAPQVVYTCKQESNGRWVQDVERGVLKGISTYPWQTDTSIGDWFYNREWKYRPVEWVIHMLIDVVSKNGNLLVNIVQRPDGTLDPEVEQMLGEMADWTAVNGEAIYGTRPWTTYGEGPIRSEGGAFKEDAAFTAEDVRFTTKGDTLYALVLGWPRSPLTIRALGKSAGRVNTVRLLGHPGPLKWTQDETGLRISLPEGPPSPHAVAFAVGGVVGSSRR
jgi:alpha-L-fucosidase